ncbi:MAG: response regulator [Chloroflexota bacterium]|nr:MAG: hypothetical protein DIU68_12660 [Chloroflexota bacterium]
MRVLIVEDERNIRILLTSILRQQGFEVVEAVNGAEAVRCLQDSGPFRLVITDLRMPHMNGMALLEILNQQYPDIPVIVTSAYTLAEWATPVAASAYHSLPKPFSHRQLVEAVHEALDLTG